VNNLSAAGRCTRSRWRRGWPSCTYRRRITNTPDLTRVRHSINFSKQSSTKQSHCCSIVRPSSSAHVYSFSHHNVVLFWLLLWCPWVGLNQVVRGLPAKMAAVARVNSAFHPSGVHKSNTSLSGWG